MRSAGSTRASTAGCNDSQFAAISRISRSSLFTGTSACRASVGSTMFLSSHLSAMRRGSGKSPVPGLRKSTEIEKE